MGDSNMPPGVGVNDIPGNRPEDIELEAFWTALDEKFKAEYGDARFQKWLRLVEDDEAEDLIFDMVNIARELSYHRGYNEGKLEADLERMERDERG